MSTCNTKGTGIAGTLIVVAATVWCFAAPPALSTPPIAASSSPFAPSVAASGTIRAVDVPLSNSTGGTVLFSDNFEDGDANGWSFHGGSWSVGSAPFLNMGLICESSSPLAQAVGGPLGMRDFEFGVRVVRVDSGGLSHRFLFRVQDVGPGADDGHYYYLELSPQLNRRARFVKVTTGASPQILGQRDNAWPAGVSSEFFDLRLVVAGGAAFASIRPFGGSEHYVLLTTELFDQNGGTDDYQYGRIGMGLAVSTATYAYDDVVVTQLGSLTIAQGDNDGDGDIDLQDVGWFLVCLDSSGPDEVSFQGCQGDFDFDNDGDVDFHDFAVIQQAFTGPDAP